MKTLRMAACGLIATLALSACAQDGGDTTASPTETGAPTVTTSPTGASPTDPMPPTAVPPSKGPGLPTSGPASPPASGSMTISGTITSGVEPGCLLIDDFLLVGGPKNVLRAGAKVTVTGEVKADLMTTCQQGTPFVVQSAKAA
jgi:hypothetical protein